MAVQREAKKLNRLLTQEESVAVGLEARHELLKKAQVTGLQVHQAIQNFHSNIPYELDELHAPYFRSYFNWAKDHKLEPILEEQKVKNFRYGYAGRLDFYGKLDGEYVLIDFKTSKSVRWTYGLQLSAYKKCLEDMGHRVDRMFVVHIRPKKRGGEPRAELHEFHTPFSVFENVLNLFNYKASQDIYAKWEERTDLAAIKKEVEESTSVTLQEPPRPDAQGLPLETQDTSQNKLTIATGQPVQSPYPSYPGLVGIPNSVPVYAVFESVEDSPTSHKDSQPEIRADETSSPQTETPPKTQPSIPLLPNQVVVFDEARSYRTPLDVSPVPLGTDISEELELSIQPRLNEPDTPPAPRP